MPSLSHKTDLITGFERWRTPRFVKFCSLLPERSTEGKAAGEALLAATAETQEGFAQRTRNVVQLGQLPGACALPVAELSDIMAPRACLELGFEVLKWAKNKGDNWTFARAICYLNTACAVEDRNPNTKITAYQTAFQAAAQGNAENIVVSLGALLPYAAHFLRLVNDRKRWDIAEQWLPLIQAAHSAHGKEGYVFFEVDRELIARITETQAGLKLAKDNRKDPAVVTNDINALLADAAEARRERKYLNAEQILASAMQYLDCSNDPKLGGLGLYADPSKLPLLAQVALVRVDTLLEGATYQFHSDTEAQDRDVARNLCQGLSHLLFSKARLPDKLRSAIAELIKRPDLLDWLSVRPSGPDLSSWEPPSV